METRCIRTNDTSGNAKPTGVQHHRSLMAKCASLLASYASEAIRVIPVRSLTYRAAWELRSALRRIQALYSLGSAPSPDVGPVWEESSPGHLVRCSRTQARNRCIQTLLSDQPYLSPADLQIFLRGWDAAEEWSGRNRIAESTVPALRA